jgi:hypothetical protein
MSEARTKIDQAGRADRRATGQAVAGADPKDGADEIGTLDLAPMQKRGHQQAKHRRLEGLPTDAVGAARGVEDGELGASLRHRAAHEGKAGEVDRLAEVGFCGVSHVSRAPVREAWSGPARRVTAASARGGQL